MTFGTLSRKDVMRFFLVGADNKTRWAFGLPGSPVRLHKPPEGVQGAPVVHDWQEMAGMDGALYRGTSDQRSNISLQVWVHDSRSPAWARAQHSRWRASLGRGKKPCRLYVITRESGYWWMDVRFESASEVNYFDQVPGRVGEIGDLINFTSDRSFWQRFPESKTFDRDTASTASIRNLGDQPAWLEWVITGQHDGLTVGIGDDTHHLPPQGPDDAGVHIDTDEVWPTFMSLAGHDLQPNFPDHYWQRPLPSRIDQPGNIPLVIDAINPANDFEVEVFYTPRTEQAW